MVATPKLADPGALIRSAKLPEKEYPVCVDPDLVAEYDRLVEARDAAREAGVGSLSGGATAELDEQIAALREEMTAATVVLRLRALPRRRWKELRAEHPPRKGDDGKTLPEDVFVGVHRDEFMAALVREELVEPKLDAETLDLLLDEKLTDAQWNDLTTVAWNLNETKVDVPFSPAVSPSRKNSAPK